MSAYQNFLDFFPMHNKERLDGLSESYFAEMTQEERTLAFNYLLKRVEAGGDEETVNGLLRADRSRAIEPVKRLLTTGELREEAQIAAAWNLWQVQKNNELLSIFFRFMSNPDHRLREKAAYYVPATILTDELKSGLQGMIRTETEQLARIHAVDKLLSCYGVTKESVGKNTFLNLYKGLHSADVRMKEAAFKQLDAIFE
jgi:hypothetical protein